MGSVEHDKFNYFIYGSLSIRKTCRVQRHKPSGSTSATFLYILNPSIHCRKFARTRARIGIRGAMAMSGAGRFLLTKGSRPMLSHNQIIRSAFLPQERWASRYPSKGSTDYSNGTVLKERDEVKETARPVIYIGAMSDTVRRVKMLSLSTCCLSVVGGPIVTFFTNPELSVIMKGALCSTMVLLRYVDVTVLARSSFLLPRLKSKLVVLDREIYRGALKYFWLVILENVSAFCPFCKYHVPDI
ncbi:hypothetical protein R1flu_020491 [Riccia fluitans]|uniref:Uncharacterized protein n=1 Tax=Riccia fluitans TaxID=41844 RepID=A0ABD1ZLP2_9MARC